MLTSSKVNSHFLFSFALSSPPFHSPFYRHNQLALGRAQNILSIHTLCWRSRPPDRYKKMVRNFEFQELLASLQLTSLPPLPSEDSTAACISDLDSFVLLEIFARCPFSELRSFMDVCTEWRRLILRYLPNLWLEHYGFEKLAIPPRSPASFFNPLNLCKRHALQREDNLHGIALRNNLNVGDLMRFNNLISEGSLASRDYLYIPLCKSYLDSFSIGF